MARIGYNIWPSSRGLWKWPLLLAMANTTYADADDTLTLSLPKQSLAATLIELGRKAKVSIIFSGQQVSELQSVPVEGELPLLKALDVVLAGSNLQYRVISKQAVAIIPRLQESGEIVIAKGADKEPVDKRPIEEITARGMLITGSRLRRNEVNGFAPVEVLTDIELNLSGAQTLSDQLKFVPIISGNSTSTAVSNGGDGTATITLRGLPASNTLVLLNDHRVASNGFGGDAVDINTIPSAAIERIEILKDGASAIYGSDAIAGVVNVILHKEFDGLQLETYYGQTSKGDNDTVTTNLIWGGKNDRGSFMLAASYFDQAGFNSRDRDFSGDADGRARGGRDKRSSATPAARISLGDNTFILEDGATGSDIDDFRQVTDEDLFNFAAFTSSLTPSERGSIYLNSTYQLSDRISANLSVSYTRTESEIAFAPTPVFTAFELNPIIIAVDNSFNPFGEEIGDLRRRMLELGDRTQINNNQASRLTMGLTGTVAGWRWSAHYNWSQSRAKERVTGLVDAFNLQRGVGPASECGGDCVAINLFGPSGSLTPEQVDFLEVEANSLGNTQLRNLTVDFSRDLWSLPAGDLGLALGLEVRHESISITPDPLAQEGALIGGINFSGSLGSRDVMEAYMEWLVPLVANSEGGSQLNLSVALRYSDYSDFGTTTNPKISIKYQPSEHWTLRTTYSKGFRAPSLIELFKGTSQDQATLDDPCSNPANVGVLFGCQQQSDPSRNQYLVLLGGEVGLTPETSRNLSFGVVWEPATLADFSLSVDFFDIAQNDIIDANAQFFVTANAEFGMFPDRVIRDSNGEIVRVISTQENLGIRRLSGFDLAAHWHQHMNWLGMLSTNFSTTYLQKYLSQVSPLAPSKDLAGTFEDAAADGSGALPKWKTHLSFYLQRNNWEAAYSINYIGSLGEELAGLNTRREISSWLTHDIQLTYLFTDSTHVTAGVDNALDRDPPFVASAFNDNFDSRNYDGIGRFWYTRLTHDF